MTSHYISGAVRFPVDLHLYRRYAEITQWEKFVLKHFPGTTIPKKKKERQKLYRHVDETLLQAPEFLEFHQQFRAKIDLKDANGQPIKCKGEHVSVEDFVK